MLLEYSKRICDNLNCSLSGGGKKVPHCHAFRACVILNSSMGLSEFYPEFKLLYFAMYNAHYFDKLLRKNIKMCIIPGYNDYIHGYNNPVCNAQAAHYMWQKYGMY